MPLERKPMKRGGGLGRSNMKTESKLTRTPMKRSRDTLSKRRGKPSWAKKGSKASNLIDQCDRIFSLYIRARDADENGVCRCFTCDKPLDWKKKKGYSGAYEGADAGHWVSRGNYSVRWDPLNVKAQCKTCNRQGGGESKKFEERLIEELGEQAVYDLKKKGREIRKYSIKELKQVLHIYKSKLKEELKAKGLEL